MPVYRVIDAQLGRARLRQWRLRAIGFLALLAGMILVFAAGLALLDNSPEPLDARFQTGLWNSINLVTTLGDFTHFNRDQRAFMLAGMVVVMVLGAFAIDQLTGILSSDAVVTYRENRAMQRSLASLRGHAVVIGFVGLGRRVAQCLRDAGQTVLVIDRNPAQAGDASSLGFLVVQGDAGIDDDVLNRARIGAAAALYVTTGDPNRNLAITLMSHTLNEQLEIVVTGTDARWGEMFSRAGASRVVIADDLLAQAMISAARAPQPAPPPAS